MAADFFTSEVWTLRGLVTYYTVFVIEPHSRRVQLVACTPHPGEAFMLQIARQMTEADGLLHARRVPICDRDRKWSTAEAGGALAAHLRRRHSAHLSRR
jgi:putative transposase